jgi:hypothetical protein
MKLVLYLNNNQSTLQFPPQENLCPLQEFRLINAVYCNECHPTMLLAVQN